MDWSNLKVKKMNKTTRAIVGNITYHVNQDDTFLVEVLGFHKQGGEYRLMPYKLPQTGFCTALNNGGLFYPELVKTSTFPKPLACPFTAVQIQKVFCFSSVATTEISRRGPPLRCAIRFESRVNQERDFVGVAVIQRNVKCHIPNIPSGCAIQLFHFEIRTIHEVLTIAFHARNLSDQPQDKRKLTKCGKYCGT